MRVRPVLSFCLTFVSALVIASCGSDSGPNAPSGTKDPTGPAAASIQVTSQPAGAAAGQAFTTQPVLEVRDANGAIVGVDNVTVVTAAIASGGGTLQGTTTATAVGGVVAFSDLGVGGIAGERTLAFSAQGLAEVTSAPFPLTPGPAAQAILEDGNDQQGGRGELLGKLLVIGVSDDFGNGVPDVAVEWSITGDGTVSPVQPLTDSTGQASAQWVMGSSLGIDTATAAVVGTLLPPVVFVTRVVRVWVLLNPTLSPSAREAPLMAYATSRDVTVLFGGLTQAEGPTNAETWEFDGTDWRQIVTVTSPPALNQTMGAMVYDSARGRVVVFATENPTKTLWEFDGTDWTAMSYAGGLFPSRCCTRATFDAKRNKTVIFGGFRVGFMNDTWEFDGTGWIEIVTSPTSTPSVRREVSMAYDAERQQTVVVGGWDGVQNLNDAWQYDGLSWVSITRPSAFPSSSETGLVFDPAARTLLFALGSQTWEWDGSSWTLLGAGVTPSFNGHFGIAFDVARDQVVVFGNNPFSSQTWIYR